MDTLAVRLTVPLVGPVADFHRQVIQVTTTVTGIAPVKALRAMPGAQRKRPPFSNDGLLVTITDLLVVSFIQCFTNFLAPLGEHTLQILDVVLWAEFPVFFTDGSFTFDQDQQFAGF